MGKSSCCAVTLLFLVTVGICEGSILIGDNYLNDTITIYTLDTSTDPPVSTDIYTILDFAYQRGCIDNSDNIVYLFYGKANQPHRIDALDPFTGKLLYFGPEFTLPEGIEDVKCDSVWHTVILASTPSQHHSVVVYNAVPATGEVTVMAVYNASDYQLQLIPGQQAYDSQSHQYIFPNEYLQKIENGIHFNFGTLLAFQLDNGTIGEYPWETEDWNFQSPSAVVGGEYLLVIGMFSRSLATQSKQQLYLAALLNLEMMDYKAGPTYTDVGGDYVMTDTIWGVGTAYIPQINHFFGYEAPTRSRGSYLLDWDVDTGIRTKSQQFLVEPLTWVSYLTP